MDYKFEEARVWIAGARGMAGSALARQYPHAIPDPSREELDLRHQDNVKNWVSLNRPDMIVLAAARVGGIADNIAHPADFIADNLQIQTNVITAAMQAGVTRLVFLASSCIYPRAAPQPMREEDLMSGPPDDSNRAYAVAKLAGVEMVRACRAQHGCRYISVLPCNLYGPGDTYDPLRSHVIPALMLKIRDAIETGAPVMTVWGTGRALREFMHVDDMAAAVWHLARHYDGDMPVNIGTGEETSIADLAAMLCAIAGYEGKIVFDPARPEGVPRKVLDVTRLSASSWRPRIPLRQGLEAAWRQFLALRPLSAPRPSSLLRAG